MQIRIQRSELNERISKRAKVSLGWTRHSLDKLIKSNRRSQVNASQLLFNMCVCVRACALIHSYSHLPQRKMHIYIGIMTTITIAQLLNGSTFPELKIRPYGCYSTHPNEKKKKYTENCPYRTISRIWMFECSSSGVWTEFNFQP